MKTSILPLLLLFIVSCSKRSGGDNDNEAPVIMINTPTNNQVFNGTQNITISGMATDNKYIKEIHIEVTNLTTAEQYLHTHIHPDANNYTFNQPYTIGVGIAYKIRVIADDGSANSTSESVEISCN
jgi:hypothetical protein